MSKIPINDNIDAIITWVDGSDKKFLNLKNEHHRLRTNEIYSPEEFGEHRYKDSGELEFAIKSILRYAPYIKTIYIVHCQTQLIRKLLSKIIPPGSEEKIKTVHHSIIYRNYEEFLPTFNSLAIETMLHRIPGLSEKYIYMNDDFFLIRKTQPTDFFRKGIPLSSG